jgi:hypothetical protein
MIVDVVMSPLCKKIGPNRINDKDVALNVPCAIDRQLGAVVRRAEALAITILWRRIRYSEEISRVLSTKPPMAFSASVSFASASAH